jgi:hypothetical protein
MLSGSKGINFGWSVALTVSEHSGFLAVGAPYYQGGAVYLYSFSKSESVHTCSITSLNDGNPFSRPSKMFTSFGSSVAFGKSSSSYEFQQEVLTHLFVSAPLSSSPARPMYGDGEAYAYVFNSQNKTFELEKIFRPALRSPSTLGTDQGFGYSIAASDRSLFIIGSPSGTST